MTDIAIRVAGLGKRYKIGARQRRHKTLGETLTDAVKSPFRRSVELWHGAPSGKTGATETIWALENVSLEIGQGEVVGIVGRNGAGKSTLLKILSRITEPTTGFAEIHGRVGSLLEVGTGFHGELTGRENIFLNGAILGMKRAEINGKLDEIVEFADVGPFIDTPVKHYSTGMHLRLAFAVAAHLEPEILIVDEVLAVGDVNFQRKCLNKMQDVGQRGKTVLLVSHNMAAITRLCARAILIDRGRIIGDGPSHQVTSAYLGTGSATAALRGWPDAAKAPGGEVARLRALRIRSDDGRIAETIDIRRPVTIEMEYDVLKPDCALLPYFQFHTQEGILAFESNDLDPAWRGRPRPAGRWVSVASIPGNLLSEGMLFVSAGLLSLDPARNEFFLREAVVFQVVENEGSGSARGDWAGPFGGSVRPKLDWNTRFSPVGNDRVELVTDTTKLEVL